MIPTRKWLPRLTLLAALLTLARVAELQAQTPEGTVITNVATVTYTDANANTYTPVTASVSVTVGFAGGLSLTGLATVSPNSPSTADTIAFTYTNVGNGNDSLRVTEAISVPGVMTVTGYRVNGVTYAQPGGLAALNLALSGILVPQNGTLVIKVIYDVAAGQGGIPTNYTLTGFSRRDASKTQAATTTVFPSLSAGVTVTPDGAQNLLRLPSNATNYTAAFTVRNDGTGPDNFNLVVSHPGTAVTIVSVNGVGGSSATLSGLGAGVSQVVNVIYTVLNVAAGAKDTLYLTATSVANNTVHDQGFVDLTVIKAALAVAKAAYRDDQTTLIGVGLVLPGEFIQYKLTVTNNGGGAAANVQISDPLPATLTFQSAAGDAAGWTITNVGNTVTATLSGSLASGASRYIWIRARIN
jgi:trimeric autotransporter adhesin